MKRKPLLFLILILTVAAQTVMSANMTKVSASYYVNYGTGMDNVIANAVTDAANEDVTINLTENVHLF